MKRVWRNGGRVLSAILAAAMIFTSLPVSGVTAYADEITAQETMIDVGETVTDVENSPEAESASDADAASNDETAADGEAATDGENAADGETTAEEETTPADGETTADSGEPSDEEIDAEDEAAAQVESAPEEAVEETELSLASTSESNFTWDGTTITRYNGTATSVVIPANATDIGSGAFAGNMTLESVTFAGSVTSIGELAFNNCTSLRHIELPDGLETIGESAFRNCTSLTQITIPAKVTSIGRDAFENSVTYVEYAEGATTACRLNAPNVTEIVLPDTVTTISSYAFSACSELERITMSANLQTIGYGAFMDCTSLERIDIPDSVTTIETSAFVRCTALTWVHVSGGLTSVNSAFGSCDAIEYLEFGEGMTEIPNSLGAKSVQTIQLPSTVKTISASAFDGYTNLTTINLPEGLTEIGNNAFWNCTSLRHIELPDTLESIGSHAFAGCTALAEVHWPEALRSIGEEGFYHCTSLTSVTLPEGMTGVGKWTFVGCTALTELNLPDTMEVIGEAAFSGCTALSEFHWPTALRTIGDRAFSKCTSLTDVTLPSELKEIGSSAFSECTSLTSIHLPDGLQTIGKMAFYGCSALTEIELPDTVETLGLMAFYECSSLTSADLGEGLITLEVSTFYGCTSLTEVYLPDGLQTIGERAFYDCYSLRTINMPSSLRTIASNAFVALPTPMDQITELRFEGDGDIDINIEAFYGYDNTRDVPVYCAEGSKVYDYFIDKEGFVVYPLGPVTEYSITYDLNGGTLPKGKTNPSTYDITKVTTLVAPTKAGAVFAGWKVNDTDTVITNNKIPANTYTGQLTLTAQWREYAYQIIWNKNAKDAVGSMDTATVSYSEEYTIPEEGYTRAGYDFLGWNTAANGKGTGYAEGDTVKGLASKDGAKVTLYAQWQKGIYEIVYVMNDGETSPAVNNKSNPDSYSVAQKVSLKAPTRTGYLFDGWYTDAALATKVTTITSAMGDVTVYAKWTPITYTITFNKNKGTLPAGAAMNNITATYDKAETLPVNAFTRTGYTFLGWDLTAASKAEEPAYMDGAEVSNLSSKNKAKVTLYAKWQINQIPITYVLNGTEEDPATNSSKNPAYVTIAKNVVLVAPTRAGYKFGGWFTDEALTQALVKNTIAKTTTDPVTVYASWIENSYTLKLDKNGGTYDIPKEVDGRLVVGKHEYEDEFLLPDGTGASRTNYEFTGWNTKKDRTGTHYEPGQTVSGLAAKGTVTLYAEWTPVADQTYTITYHGIDESWDNSKNPSVYSFEKDIKLANPTKAGYTFKGWYAEDPSENPKAKKVTSISKKSTENIELYGVWTENSYTISYNANKGILPKGVKMNAQTALYSEDVDLTTNAFTRKGYEFDGWNTKANGRGTKVDGTVGNYADGETVRSLTAKNKGKVTLYAQWKAIDYSITYVGAENGVDGVVNTNPTTYTIAKDVKLVNPTAYGYTFKGWYNDDPETDPKAKKVTKIAKTTCKDMTVYALWSENRYNLRFSTNSLFGSSVKSVTNRLYTEEFNIPATEPTREGYTFQGWALTRDGEAIFHAGDSVTFADIHDAGGTAKGLVGTKYFTLYAIFAEE